MAQVASSLRPGYFLAAIIAGVGLTLVQGIYLWRLMGKNGSALPAAAVVAAFMVGQPGKYVPGKIWAPLMQKAALGPDSSLVLIGMSNLELALVVLVQMTSLGITCLFFDQPWLALPTLLAGILSGAAALRVDLLARMALLMPRMTARLGMTNTRSHRLNKAGWLHAFWLSAAVLMATLLTSWLVLAAMGTENPWPDQAAILGTLFLGFGSSLVVFPVPAGLGIREAATAGIGVFTAPGITAAELVSVALFARLWQLAVDLVCLAVGLGIASRRRHA